MYCAMGCVASAHATPASVRDVRAPVMPSKPTVTEPPGVDTVTGEAHAEGATAKRPEVLGTDGKRAEMRAVMFAARGWSPR